MIPPPDQNDDTDSHSRYEEITSGMASGIGPDLYYGYEDDLLTKVKTSFARFGLPVDGQPRSLVKGLFEDTLILQGTETKVAFAHVDCDWYSPVKLCLERLWPHVSKGGRVILDDYLDFGGCRRATDEWHAKTPDALLRRFVPHAIIEKTQ